MSAFDVRDLLKVAAGSGNGRAVEAVGYDGQPPRDAVPPAEAVASALPVPAVSPVVLAGGVRVGHAERKRVRGGS